MRLTADKSLELDQRSSSTCNREISERVRIGKTHIEHNESVQPEPVGINVRCASDSDLSLQSQKSESCSPPFSHRKRIISEGDLIRLPEIRGEKHRSWWRLYREALKVLGIDETTANQLAA
jgi:hypothetical protein